MLISQNSNQENDFNTEASDKEVFDSIDSFWDEINQELVNYSTELLLFDYSYIIATNEASTTDVKTYYKHKIPNYEEKFDIFLEKYGNAFEVGKPKITNNDFTVFPSSDVKRATYSEANTSLETTEIEYWHNFVKEQKIAGAALTLHSQWNNIVDFGVYLLLSAPINIKENVNLEQTLVIKRILRLLELFLFKEGKKPIEERYSKLIQHRDALEVFQNRVLDHQHTIFNLSPRDLLVDAIRELERGNITDANQSLNETLSQIDLLYLSLHASFDRVKDHILTKKKLSQIIKFIEHTNISSTTPVIEYDIEEEMDFVHKKEKLNDVWLVLWNLWHNASKRYFQDYSDEVKFWIKLYSVENKIFISFINEKAIEERWRKFLTGEQDSLKENEGRGLRIIKDRVRKLGWKLYVNVDRENNKTEIIVNIKRSGNEDIND